MPCTPGTGLGDGSRLCEPTALYARSMGVNRKEKPGTSFALRLRRKDSGAAERNRQVLLIMVAFGTWGLAHRDGERRLRVWARVLSPESKCERSSRFLLSINAHRTRVQ